MFFPSICLKYVFQARP